MEFQKLFEPIQIGRLLLSNRIVSPPLSSGSAKDGFITDRLLAFYQELAGSGVGLVIVEDSIVDTPVGKHHVGDIHVDDDKYIPGLARLAETIKSQGARAAIQISHAGRQAGRLLNG